MPQFNLTVLSLLSTVVLPMLLQFRKQVNAQSGPGLNCHRLNSVIPVHIAHVHTLSVCMQELSSCPSIPCPHPSYFFGRTISCMSLDVLLWVLHETQIFIHWDFGNGITPHPAFQQLYSLPWDTYPCILCLQPNTRSLATPFLSLPPCFSFAFPSAVLSSHYHLLFASLKQTHSLSSWEASASGSQEYFSSPMGIAGLSAYLIPFFL